MKSKKLEFSICESCNRAFAKCPRCGNLCCESCNGEDGEKGKCPICPLVYEFIDTLAESGYREEIEDLINQKEY